MSFMSIDIYTLYGIPLSLVHRMNLKLKWNGWPKISSPTKETAKSRPAHKNQTQLPEQKKMTSTSEGGFKLSHGYPRMKWTGRWKYRGRWNTAM